MFIKSQCGTAFIDSHFLAGVWVKSYNEKRALLKAHVDGEDVILGIYESKSDALAALDKLLEKLNCNGYVYQI